MLDRVEHAFSSSQDAVWQARRIVDDRLPNTFGKERRNKLLSIFSHTFLFPQFVTASSRWAVDRYLLCVCAPLPRLVILLERKLLYSTLLHNVLGPHHK